MPWSYPDDVPRSMKNLPERMKKKAVEIANAVLREEQDDGKAIRIGISTAKSFYGAKNGKHSTRVKSFSK